MKEVKTRTKITPLQLHHSDRFRRVDNVFARAVAQAYEGDIAKAAKDTDEQVFARVRAWEIREGRESQNWPEIAERNALIDAGYDVDDA